MKVGIIQPSYIPWRGYFDFIDEVDLFVFLDDVQYSKQGWRNRNRVKSAHGVKWLTVPVKVGKLDTLINEVRIDYSSSWVRQHINTLQGCYARAPHFDRYSASLFDILRSGISMLSELDISLTRWIMVQLDIGTPVMLASDLRAQGRKTERVIDILKKLRADCYLSGPAAKDYLDEEMFQKEGIRLEYKRYDYPPYPQLWGDFIGEVTVLDLLFNAGPDARRYLKSLAPNEVAVP